MISENSALWYRAYAPLVDSLLDNYCNNYNYSINIKWLSLTTQVSKIISSQFTLFYPSTMKFSVN